MHLDCYKVHEFVPEIVPGSAGREWMDTFQDRQPYRCLPLTMANSMGWEILCPLGLTIEWNGGPMEDAVLLKSTDAWPPVSSVASSHFRRGIITFHTGYLFRTPPGWAVWAMGPPNTPKDGIYPLSGLIETEWLPFPFTMNWKMTRPGRVRFEKGEPFCFITLIEYEKLEQVQPTLRLLESNEALHKEFKVWAESRTDFNKRLKNGEDEALRARWQRHYLRGINIATGDAADNHATKRKLKAPMPPPPDLRE